MRNRLSHILVSITSTFKINYIKIDLIIMKLRNIEK